MDPILGTMISHNIASNKAARPTNHSSHRNQGRPSDDRPRDDHSPEPAPPPQQQLTTIPRPHQRIQNPAYDPNASQTSDQDSYAPPPRPGYTYPSSSSLSSSSSSTTPPQSYLQAQQQQPNPAPYAVRQPLPRAFSDAPPSPANPKAPPPIDRSHSYAAAATMSEPDAVDYENYGKYLDAPPPALARSRRESASSVYRPSTSGMDRPRVEEDEEDYRYEGGSRSGDKERNDRRKEKERAKMGSRKHSTNDNSDDVDRRPTYGDSVFAFGRGVKQLVKGHK